MRRDQNATGAHRGGCQGAFLRVGSPLEVPCKYTGSFAYNNFRLYPKVPIKMKTAAFRGRLVSQSADNGDEAAQSVAANEAELYVDTV